MWKLLVRLAINAVAIWVAAMIIGGMTLTDDFWGIALVALLFGVINAFIKPVAVLLGLPFIIVTLGLFTLVINAGLLGLTSALTDALTIDGFWSAFFGALVVSVVSWFLSSFLDTKKEA